MKAAPDRVRVIKQRLEKNDVPERVVFEEFDRTPEVGIH
jgi:hypothetical protein